MSSGERPTAGRLSPSLSRHRLRKDPGSQLVCRPGFELATFRNEVKLESIGRLTSALQDDIRFRGLHTGPLHVAGTEVPGEVQLS